ncbi:MAG TPA: hypothetical protein VN660_09725 [Steroidobacteraceae bacterium]|nr:hypothetical protein [Steroidobacteraceae bacterium]
MSEILTTAELTQLRSAAQAYPWPVPTQAVSNGEFMPAPQNARQREVEGRIRRLCNALAARHGLDRRAFLASAAGMATAFVAMNEVYGAVFAVDTAEASEPGVAAARADSLASQTIIDLHTHFLRDDSGPGLQYFAELREKMRQTHQNPELPDRPATLADLHLGTYVREIWFDSDTKIAALSGAPSDLGPDWLLPNQSIAETRDSINRFAGSRRLLSHFIFTPGQPGWLEEIDRGIEELHPDAWKGYTIGDNTHKDLSRYPWRMDDEQLAYRGYEKFAKAGIRSVAVHKGLYTRSDERRYPRLKQFAQVGDVGKAARDWPQLNFLIYHAAYRYTGEGEPAIALAEFERTGRMEWVSDLAEIPAKYGVSNVYADIGASFAACCVSEPRTAAAMLGILTKGLGVDHVLWGTDSIWFGSPQWQIEALRRLEIPAEMQRRHGFAPLGPADGPTKTAIFGMNAARIQQLPLTARWQSDDALEHHRLAYHAQGYTRSNRAYGYIRAARNSVGAA